LEILAEETLFSFEDFLLEAAWQKGAAKRNAARTTRITGRYRTDLEEKIFIPAPSGE